MRCASTRILISQGDCNQTTGREDKKVILARSWKEQESEGLFTQYYIFYVWARMCALHLYCKGKYLKRKREARKREMFMKRQVLIGFISVTGPQIHRSPSDLMRAACDCAHRVVTAAALDAT